MLRAKYLPILLLVGLIAVPAAAQNPSGTLSGQVTANGDALPGVVVTASSPALQGVRTTVTSIAGDYLIRFLPPGEYTVSFELDGFAPAEQSLKISAAQASELDVQLNLAEVAEQIEVVASFDRVSTNVQSSTTFDKTFIEKLPVDRDIEGAVTLTPGVSETGPAENITISGSASYENLFLVNGVVVNENLRGQPFDLFIEDAIEETTTSTSGISAEYGRFAGGVVNVITKSGGNEFNGSFRTSFENESWEDETPLTVTQANDVNETFEATLGGYALKDRLWFFLAGRTLKLNEIDQTVATNLPYDDFEDETRIEGKVTATVADGHRLVGSYLKIDEKQGGVKFGSILDLDSIYTRSLPQELLAGNYTGVISPNFFVEAQYSEREFTFEDSGSRFTDRIDGTLFVDRPTGQRWHAPTFCGVCEPDEMRNNENYLIKASWFLSNETVGAHDVVFGYDSYTDIRLADNHQSGSDFRIILGRTLLDPDGVTLYPVFNSRAYIQWNPILVGSKGTDFVTNSFFVNDSWRLDDRWSFNIGLRYDENDGRDSEGKLVANDNKISPRIGAIFDPKADGEWLFTASYGEYVTAIANSQGNATSAGGSPANFQWFYQGPDINNGVLFDPNTRVVTGGDTPVDADTALQMLWDWFDSVGNTNLAPTRALSIPGGTTVIQGSLASPSTIEYAAGFSKRLGRAGLVRVDYIRREGNDFYVDRRDLTTGTVTTGAGGLADLSVIENNDSVLERSYDGVHAQIRYRINDRLDVGGNYTWSQARGNTNAETRNSGPVRSTILRYPEYRDLAWNNPSGPLAIDQRHRVRGWLNYDLWSNDRHDLNLSVLQNFFSGRPYSAVGSVDTRPFVSNPGYVRPPSSVTYFFSDRGAFTTDDSTRTDLALNYSFNGSLGTRDFEIFLQPEVINVFGEEAVVNTDSRYFDTTIFDETNTGATSCNGAPCQSFDPFTETPVEGVHWAKGPNFGQATNPQAFQTPRTFRFSVGFRF